MMFVVAVNHLLDVVVVVAFVSDVLPVADRVATVGNGAGDWHGSLSLSPDYCRSPRHPRDDADIGAVVPEPVEGHVGSIRCWFDRLATRGFSLD